MVIYDPPVFELHLTMQTPLYRRRRTDGGGVGFERSGCRIRTVKVSVYERRIHKLPVETINLLRDYRQWYVELRFKNGDQWHETGYVFVQDNGEPMNPDSITQWLGKFSQRNGLPHINPHKFRHTMASLLYYNGFDSITISKRLGHAKVSTTTDIYSHIIKRADEKAADCIADVVLRPPKQA